MENITQSHGTPDNKSPMTTASVKLDDAINVLHQELDRLELKLHSVSSAPYEGPRQDGTEPAAAGYSDLVTSIFIGAERVENARQRVLTIINRLEL